MLALAGVAAALGLVACGGDDDKVVVPEVEGLPLEGGVERVCGRFLEPAVAVDDEVPPSSQAVVVGSEPAAGEEVAVGSEVTLLLPPAPGGARVIDEPSCESP